MTEIVMPALLAVNLVVLLVLVILVIKLSRLGTASSALAPRLETLERLLERNERTLRDELGRGREEAQAIGRQGREESLNAVQLLGDGLLQRMSELAGLQKASWRYLPSS